MRYFLSVVCFLAVHLSMAQQSGFDFEEAWETVYKAELQYLPKSASQKVDSIYQEALRLDDAQQRIKATLYQAKFLLILEEDAVQKLVARFQEEIRELDQPASNILQNQLARLYLDYYNRWKWRINELTTNPNVSEELKTWDKTRFFTEIRKLYLSSLDLDTSLLNSPLSEYEYLLKANANHREFRPLLIDLLAHNALEFFTKKEQERNRPAETFMMKEPDLMSLAAPFADLVFTHPDSDSYHLQALKIYQMLTRIHQSDTTAWASTDLSIHRLKFVKEQGVISGVNDLYRQALIGLRKQLGTDPAAILPDLSRADLENELGSLYEPVEFEQYQFKKAEAVAILDSLLDKYPPSSFREIARNLRRSIVQKRLSITTQSFLLPNEPSKLLVTNQNFDQLYFRTFRINPEQWDDLHLKNTDSLKTAFMSTLIPVEDWEVSLKNEKDFQEHRQEVLFPSHGLGAYLVAGFEDNGRTQLLALDMVQVTQLALVQVHQPNQQTYRVIDRMKGESVPNVKVHLYSHPMARGEKIDRWFTTDEHGEFTYSSKNWYSNVRVRLIHGEDSVRFTGQYFYANREPGKSKEGEYHVKAELFSDRAIYRPGQELYFKAIVFKQSKSGSEVVAGERFTLTLYDPEGKDLWYEYYTSNEFGSIAGKLTLPKTGMTGRYKLIVEPESRTGKVFRQSETPLVAAHHFRIEEYKRPKFEVTLSPIEAIYHFGDSVKIEGQATALAGSQLSGAKVTYDVKRKMEPVSYGFSSYYRMDQEPSQIAHGETLTDDEGFFTIPFQALPDPAETNNEAAIANYSVNVTVTDLNGESRSNSTVLFVSKKPYTININAQELYDQAQDSIRLPVFIRSLNGAPQELGGNLKIAKLQAPASVKRLVPWEQPDYPGFTREEHDRLFPHWPYGNEADRNEWPVKQLYAEKNVAPGQESEVKIGGFQNWPSGYYKATFSTVLESGDSLVASKVFMLREMEPRALPDHSWFEAWLDKGQYAAGDTALLTLGSAVPGLGVQLSIQRKDKVEHFRFTLNNEVRQIEIPIKEGDEEGLSVYYYHTALNSFQKGALVIEVIKKWPRLTLETGTFRNKLQPGNPETWSFKVKGENGEATSAELLASMYDASLDQFAVNRWSFDPFYQYSHYRYNQTNPLGSFRTYNFRTFIRSAFYAPLSLEFDQWDWFGLSISNPKYSQSNYVNSLRFRRNARPVMKSEKRDLPEGIIEGRVFDEFGNPFKFANVTVAGTTTGDVVNKEGGFRLSARPGQELYVSFIGYKTFRLPIGDDNYYEIQLLPDNANLEEVVVVGYGSQERKEIVAIPDDEEIEEEIELDLNLFRRSNASLGYSQLVPETRIRGLSASGAGKELLIVVDGRVGVNLEDLNPEDILSIERLEPVNAQTLYGAKGVNGAIVIVTKSELNKQNALLAQVKARTNLKETAFFYPQLKTNEEGEVSFEFESPESLTRWKLQLLAHDKTMASDLLRQSVVTQKDLMVLPNLPRFLREGDQITLSAKISSLSTDSLTGFARLELFDAISEESLGQMIQAPAVNPGFSLAPNGNTAVSWQLQIPEGVQAVRYRIVAVAGDFSDGEESVLPVLSKRVLVHESLPLWANANSSKTFNLKKLSEPMSNSLRHHRLSFHVTTNPLWEAIRSLPYLMEYPYECAEQIFARFYANSLGRHLVEEQPEIQAVFEKWRETGPPQSKLELNPELKALLIEETPWLREARNEAEQQQRMATLFEVDQLAEGLEASLDQLRKLQMSSGGFPWFAGSSHANRYITQHIVAGLLHLSQLTGAEDFTDITDRGLRYLGQELVNDLKRLKARDDFNPNLRHISYTQLKYLYASSMSKPEINSELEEAMAFYKDQAYAHWHEMGLPSQAMVALVAHRQGDESQAQKIMASLREYSLESEEMGIYWKSNVAGWRKSQAPIETQALLIEAFHEVMADEAYVNGLRKWLLNQKRTQSWTSSKATTEALYALLATGTDWTGENKQVTVAVGAETILSPDRSESGTEAGTGYAKKIWTAENIKPELGQVVIENDGKTQVWGGLHWQYFEDLDKITAAQGPLSLEKQLYRVKQTDTGEQLEKLEADQQLQIGDLVRVRLILKTDRAMEFIHLKDMRAAGFEPVNVLSSFQWQDRLGYYESTRDAATNFFIEYMPKGTFVFEYDLRASNAGHFSNGITSFQNMYAPEFSSHTEGIRVRIGN